MAITSSDKVRNVCVIPDWPIIIGNASGTSTKIHRKQPLTFRPILRLLSPARLSFAALSFRFAFILSLHCQLLSVSCLQDLFLGFQFVSTRFSAFAGKAFSFGRVLLAAFTCTKEKADEEHETREHVNP